MKRPPFTLCPIVRARTALIAVVSLSATLAAAGASADVTVSSAETQNISCSDGICAPTAKKAVLNLGDLETMLASGNVELTTVGPGVQADSIKIDAALTWSSTNTLALEAYNSIVVSGAVSVAGPGGLALTTNDGGSDGTLSFGPKGSVGFASLSSYLSIDGVAYTLESSVKGLAAAIAANPAGAFALANDYDASQDGIYSDCPIYFLSGRIDGLGNAVSHLSIDAEGLAAFIGSVAGAVENLRLTDINYEGHGNFAPGGLAVDNYGYLFGDEVTGSIVSRHGSARNAGLRASAASQEGARARPPKHVYPDIGGLVTDNADTGLIVSSSTNVRIKGGFGGLVGGLVASNVGTISLSTAKGSVSGWEAGGLVGGNIGAIDQSYSTGAVTGTFAGGLVGVNADDPDVGTITNSYSTGNAGLGGFIDYYEGGDIESSYSTGSVTTGGGGFACGIDGPVSSDYWDTTTSGTDYGGCSDENVSGITGLTTQQLQSGLPEGFDPTMWAENPKINNGLPYLIGNPPNK